MELVMISPLRLTQLIAALGVLFLTACGTASPTAPVVTAPGVTRAAGAAAYDVDPCSGYSVANGKC
jgi:hypothetical protein